jgi:iron complex outermembrane receptor protein
MPFAVTVCAMASAAAAASATQPSGADGSAAGAAVEVSEILVTAERRSENLQTVPVSESVVSGANARSILQGGADILALSGQVPGLYIESTTGRIFPRFYIRGLGNTDYYLGASQPVSILQDDVILEHVTLKSNPIFDVDQIEVLRGPQGSLFGRNTTAGVIKFDSVKPSDSFNARIDGSWGEYNSYSIDAGVGGPIIPGKLDFRVSALDQHRDNWIANTFSGMSDDGTPSPSKDAMGGFDERDARLQLLAMPLDTLTVLGSLHLRDYSGSATVFHRGGLVTGSNSPIASIKSASYDEGFNNPQAYRGGGGSVNIANDFGPVTLTSITALETISGYSRGDTDGGSGPWVPNLTAPSSFTPTSESEGHVKSLAQVSEEIRLASNGKGPLKWQVGALDFYNDDTTDFFQRGYFLLPSAAGYNPNNWVELKDHNVSWAVFGQASYSVTPDFTVTVGARETQDSKQTTLVKLPMTAGGVSTFPTTAATNVKLTDEKPSFDLSGDYRISSDVSVYARLASGFRGPTIQGRSAVFGSPFTTANSETILSGEVGVKSELLDRTLRLNVSAFTYDVHNIQLNGYNQLGFAYLFNADNAKAYGLEADSEWRPVHNLTLTAGLSLLHTEIDDNSVYAQACTFHGLLVCTVQNPVVFANGAWNAKLNGNALPDAPTYNLNVSARYDYPLASGDWLFVATDWKLQGQTLLTPYKAVEFTTNGTYEGGLRFGYRSAQGYEVAAFARNVTDQRNVIGVLDTYLAPAYNEPRIIGVSVDAKFH